VVTDDGMNNSLLKAVALQQKIARDRWNIRFLNITSGAGKMGRIIGRQNGLYDLTKEEASFKGFDHVMNCWMDNLNDVGLKAVRIALTGYDLTKRELVHHQKVIADCGDTNFVINTHDGLNSARYRYCKDAANNDVVGEKFAGLQSDIYIICTNVDGVYNKYGETIRTFDNLQMLEDIEFTQKSENGSGGMETKLWSAIRFAKSKEGRVCYIVDGKEENVILKAINNEQVGTKVIFGRY
jgi:isopentenyl phosphate kinase